MPEWKRKKKKKKKKKKKHKKKKKQKKKMILMPAPKGVVPLVPEASAHDLVRMVPADVNALKKPRA